MRFRPALILCTALCLVPPAMAQLSINFGSPDVNIGINLGAYPTLQRVPGYPVYYAPGVRSNYFFYDGLYWVYQGDNWYESPWYNGPWHRVDPYDVPVYVLRVPVRYYRHAPAYFHGWHSDEAPRWGQHWGNSWESRRHGWNEWNRSSAPPPAPLPTYQRQYTGSKYPQPSQQAVLQTQNYRYQPRDNVAREHFQYQRTQAQSAPLQQQQSQVPARARQEPRQQPQQQPQERFQQQKPPQQQQQQQQQQNPAGRQARPQPEQKPVQQPQQQQPQGKGKEKDDKDKNKDKDKDKEKNR